MTERNFITHAGTGKHYYWRTPEHLFFLFFSFWYRTIDHLCMFTLFMSLLLMSVSISHMKQICTMFDLIY